VTNLIVSTTCPMRCSFCFAGEQTASTARGPSRYLSLDEFDRRLAFLDRSGIGEVRLIGGEPTLHPQFPELVARARGRRIVVFTNGLMPERALACLESLPENECTVLLNMNATRRPDGPGVAEMRHREAVAHRLGARAKLGFTIFRVDFDLDPLFELATESGAQRGIRLGLAQPILGGGNEYLHPKQYPAVGRRIAGFAQRGARAGASLELDCGFVRCMFSDEDVEVLTRVGADLGWRCSPVLDVGLDGTVSHCFPLAGSVDVRLAGDLDARELRGRLEARTRPYRLAGIYRRCSRCLWKQRGECTGGCLAATMRRFRSRSIGIGIPNERERSADKEQPRVGGGAPTHV
jgi:radical SAM family protein